MNKPDSSDHTSFKDTFIEAQLGLLDCRGCSVCARGNDQLFRIQATPLQLIWDSLIGARDRVADADWLSGFIQYPTQLVNNKRPVFFNVPISNLALNKKKI